MDRLDWTKIDWLQLSDVLYWSVGRQCTNIVTPQLALKREVRFCIILLNEWKYNMKMPNKTIELNNTRQEKTDKIVGRGWKYKKKQWQKQLESYRRIQTFTKEPSHACRRSWQTSVRIIVSFGHRCNTTPDPIFFRSRIETIPKSRRMFSMPRFTNKRHHPDDREAICRRPFSDLSGDYHG